MGYPSPPKYLAPYKGGRCHLSKWHRGMEPKIPIEKFGHINTSIRNVIERSFGLSKMKWHILYKMPPYPMFKQKMIVVANMVLNNLFMSTEVRTIALLSLVMILRSPIVPERYNKYIISSSACDGSTYKSNIVTTDVFRDELATAMTLSWN